MGVRQIVQGALVGVAVLSAAGAAYRYQTTRGDRPAIAGPKGKAVRAQPSAAPAGSTPFLYLFGFERGEEVKVTFCAQGSALCTEIARTRYPAPNLRSKPIPPVQPGDYVLRAGEPSAATLPVRGRFKVVPFEIAPTPKPRSYANVDTRSLETGQPSQIARNVSCETRFTPDDRLVIAGAVYDPRTAVRVELSVTAAELSWSPRRDRLAIVTEDRKEIRMAGADGSGAEVVAREARGLISSVTWSHEGDRIAFIARPQPGVAGGPKAPTVFVLSLVDGNRVAAGPGEWVAWSPKDERLAVEVVEGAGRAIQLSEGAGKRTRLVDGRRPAWSPDGSLIAFVRPVTGEVGAGWVTRADSVAGATLLVRQDVCGMAFSADGNRLAVVTKAPNGTTTLFLRSVSAPSRGS